MTTQLEQWKHFTQLKDLKLPSLFLSVLLQTQLRGKTGEAGSRETARHQRRCHAAALRTRAPGHPPWPWRRGGSWRPRAGLLEALPPLLLPVLSPGTQAGQWAAGNLSTFSDRGYWVGTFICTPCSALLVITVEQRMSQSPFLGWPPL